MLACLLVGVICKKLAGQSPIINKNKRKKEKTRPGFEPGTLIQGVLHLVPKGMKLPLGMD